MFAARARVVHYSDHDIPAIIVWLRRGDGDAGGVLSPITHTRACFQLIIAGGGGGGLHPARSLFRKQATNYLNSLSLVVWITMRLTVFLLLESFDFEDEGGFLFLCAVENLLCDVKARRWFSHLDLKLNNVKSIR